jgi:hypothetical protein
LAVVLVVAALAVFLAGDLAFVAFAVFFMGSLGSGIFTARGLSSGPARHRPSVFLGCLLGRGR